MSHTGITWKKKSTGTHMESTDLEGGVEDYLFSGSTQPAHV